MPEPPKRVLLVNVADPWLAKGGDRPSLGTLYLAAWLRQEGNAEPSVIDLNHDGDTGLEQRIQDFKPDLIGISLTTPQYAEAVRVARAIKQKYPETPIIAGGPHPTAMKSVPQVPELMPTDCFDYVVTGAGEKILEQICKVGLPPTRIVNGIELPAERSLDWLPEPARDLVKMDRYSLKILGRPAQPIMTSFGCPWRCSFCSEPILNNRFKAYSPERVVAEMRTLKEKWGAQGFIIYDDVYSIDAKRVMAISRSLIEQKLDIIYRCTTRASDFIRNPDLLPLMRDSGCVEICVGTESGSDAVLKVADKGMNTETNAKAIHAIHAHGMRALTYMITGLPGCSPETERASYDFIKANAPDELGWYLLAPFPSTPLWVARKKYGVEIFEDEIIKNDWDVAQCRKDNENLTCYISYAQAGGPGRREIKDLWLEYSRKAEDFLKGQGRQKIQNSSTDDC